MPTINFHGLPRLCVCIYTHSGRQYLIKLKNVVRLNYNFLAIVDDVGVVSILDDYLLIRSMNCTTVHLF